MEKLGETQLRQRDGEEKKKRKRRNGDDALKFLNEKADKDIELRKEEFKLKQSQQSIHSTISLYQAVSLGRQSNTNSLICLPVVDCCGTAK